LWSYGVAKGYRITGSCAPVIDGFAVVGCWVSLSCSGEGGFAGVAPVRGSVPPASSPFTGAGSQFPEKTASGKNFPMLFCVGALFFTFLLYKNKPCYSIS